MRRVLAAVVVLLAARGVNAEIVFSNLNTSPSASTGSGFTEYAQRFTTASSGSGFQLDLNLVSLSGAQPYAVELWSAAVSGTNVDTLLAAIGSGTVTSTDKTAVITFTSAYPLTATTDYFIKLVATSGDFAVVLGPSSSSALNSLLRYGVSSLTNSTTALAIGMKVDVVAVPEPRALALAAAVAGMGLLVARPRRHRRRDRIPMVRTPPA